MRLTGRRRGQGVSNASFLLANARKALKLLGFELVLKDEGCVGLNVTPRDVSIKQNTEEAILNNKSALKCRTHPTSRRLHQWIKSVSLSSDHGMLSCITGATNLKQCVEQSIVFNGCRLLRLYLVKSDFVNSYDLNWDMVAGLNVDGEGPECELRWVASKLEDETSHVEELFTIVALSEAVLLEAVTNVGDVKQRYASFVATDLLLMPLVVAVFLVTRVPDTQVHYASRSHLHYRHEKRCRCKQELTKIGRGHCTTRLPSVEVVEFNSCLCSPFEEGIGMYGGDWRVYYEPVDGLSMIECRREQDRRGVVETWEEFETWCFLIVNYGALERASSELCRNLLVIS